MEPGYTGNGGAGSLNATTYNTLEANTLLYLASGQEVQHGMRVESDNSVRLSDRGCMFNGYFVG